MVLTAMIRRGGSHAEVITFAIRSEPSYEMQESGHLQAPLYLRVSK